MYLENCHRLRAKDGRDYKGISSPFSLGW